MVFGLPGCPPQRSPEVIGHRVETGPPATGGGRGVLGQPGGGGQAPAQMVSPCRGELTGRGELLGTVLADRLQYPVPGAARRRGDDQQALIRQPAHPPHHPPPSPPPSPHPPHPPPP